MQRRFTPSLKRYIVIGGRFISPSAAKLMRIMRPS